MPPVRRFRSSDGADSLRQTPDEIAGFFRALFEGRYETGAGNDAVGIFRRLGGGLRIGDPETGDDRERGDGFDRPEHIRNWLVYLDNWDKVMYGSDWPLVNIPAYLALMRRVVPETMHEAVFGANARRIFHL